MGYVSFISWLLIAPYGLYGADGPYKPYRPYKPYELGSFVAEAYVSHGCLQALP